MGSLSVESGNEAVLSQIFKVRLVSGAALSGGVVPKLDSLASRNYKSISGGFSITSLGILQLDLCIVILLLTYQLLQLFVLVDLLRRVRGVWSDSKDVFAILESWRIGVSVGVKVLLRQFLHLTEVVVDHFLYLHSFPSWELSHILEILTSILLVVPE